MAQTYVRWIERITGQLALRQGAGQRLMGTLALLLGDNNAEAIRQAVRAGWVGDNDTGPAEDALGAAGDELSLPRYPNETWEQYHARLQRAWDDWPYAGHETSIVGQLEAAGFPGAVVYHASAWPYSGRPDWWSQFWVFFPEGTHAVTSPGAVYWDDGSAPLYGFFPWGGGATYGTHTPGPTGGSFAWGDGTTYGPLGITPVELLTIRSIIQKFKPARWICSGVIFEISGWTYGTGPTWGSPGLVWGGEVSTVGVP